MTFLFLMTLVAIVAFAVYRYIRARRITNLYADAAAGKLFVRSRIKSNPFLEPSDFYEVISIENGWVKYRSQTWSTLFMSENIDDFLMLYDSYEPIA